MAEKCIVTIKEEQQLQQQCPSPLGEITNDSDPLTGTPTTIITLAATTAIGLSSTTESASSTPTQSGTIDCDDQEESGGQQRGKDGYAWFYPDKGVIAGNQIHLETPTVEEKSNGGLNLTKPKRLSDEFYSADDDYDEDEDDEMVGRGGSSSNSSGSSSITGISKNAVGDGDCEAHASLNEIKNLSITNGGAEPGDDRYDQDENSISDPIYISEETSSCSSGHQRIIGEELSGRAQETEEQNRQDQPDQPLGMEQEEMAEDEGVAALEVDRDDDDAGDEDDLHDVQSIDAIERRDFEQEQKLTGGIIIRNSALKPDNHRLNLEFVSRFRMRNDTLAKKSQPEGKVQLTTTPTSSRNAYKNGSSNPSSSNSTSNREQNSNSTTKSAVKVNLSASLDSYCAATEAAKGTDTADGPSCSSSMASSSSSSASSSSKAQQQQQIDEIFNSNSNDSLSSDRSIFIPNLQALKASAKDCPTAPSSSGVNEPGTSSSSSSPSPTSVSCSAGPSTSGTTKPPSDCSLASCATSVIKQTGECSKNINHHPLPSTSTSNSSLFSYSCPFGSVDRENHEACSSGNVSLGRFPSNGSNFTDNIADEVEPSSSPHRSRQPQLHHEHNHIDDPLLEPSQLSMPAELAAAAAVVDHECDEDNWADCEEGSDEEVCTCRDYTDDEGNGGHGAGGHASSEDELPSRDVDLSSYTHMDAAEDILVHDPNTTAGAATATASNAQTPRLHRKRKLTENRMLFGSGASRGSTGTVGDVTGGGLGNHCDSPSTESLNYNSRKRLALDSTSSPRTLRSPSNVSTTRSSSIKHKTV